MSVPQAGHYAYRRAPLAARLVRLARRSPADNARLVRREIACRAVARVVETRAARAAREGRPLVAGPFLGELGFELLYWIPWLRHFLERHGARADQVTVLTRGGAAEWYRDVAAHSVEIFDLVPPELYWDRLRERRERAGDAKQLTIEPLDRELAAAALGRAKGGALLHPIVMYARLRWAWVGIGHAAGVVRSADYRRLPVVRNELPSGLTLPDRYMALKAYYSDAFPDTPENRSFLARLVVRIADEMPVVLLATGLRLDDHDEWIASLDRVVRVDRWLAARDNLALQSTLVAQAQALVATYGGFSYLGPFLGVPTLAFRSTDAWNPVHEEVLATAFGAASYTTVDARDDDGVERAVRTYAK